MKSNNLYKWIIVIAIILAVGIIAFAKLETTSSSNSSNNTQNKTLTSNNVKTNTISFINQNNQTVNIGGRSNNTEVVFTMEAGCADCAVLSESLSQISKEYSNVKFYGVDINSLDTYKELIPWVNSINHNVGDVSYVISKNSKFLEDYKVTSLDTVYIINKNGYLIYSKVLPSTNSIKSVLSSTS
jgi:thiol-disulfide isomerase/thioredoxin